MEMAAVWYTGWLGANESSNFPRDRDRSRRGLSPVLFLPGFVASLLSVAPDRISKGNYVSIAGAHRGRPSGTTPNMDLLATTTDSWGKEGERAARE